MKQVDGLCFSCRDQVEFQLFGQTPEYDSADLSNDYIQKYREAGDPNILCQNCGRNVRYEKQILTGKWREFEIENPPTE